MRSPRRRRAGMDRRARAGASGQRLGQGGDARSVGARAIVYGGAWRQPRLAEGAAPDAVVVVANPWQAAGKHVATACEPPAADMDAIAEAVREDAAPRPRFQAVAQPHPLDLAGADGL